VLGSVKGVVSVAGDTSLGNMGKIVLEAFGSSNGGT